MKPTDYSNREAARDALLQEHLDKVFAWIADDNKTISPGHAHNVYFAKCDNILGEWGKRCASGIPTAAMMDDVVSETKAELERTYNPTDKRFGRKPTGGKGKSRKNPRTTVKIAMPEKWRETFWAWWTDTGGGENGFLTSLEERGVHNSKAYDITVSRIEDKITYSEESIEW